MRSNSCRTVERLHFRIFHIRKFRFSTILVFGIKNRLYAEHIDIPLVSNQELEKDEDYSPRDCDIFDITVSGSDWRPTTMFWDEPIIYTVIGCCACASRKKWMQPISHSILGGLGVMIVTKRFTFNVVVCNMMWLITRPLILN